MHTKVHDLPQKRNVFKETRPGKCFEEKYCVGIFLCPQLVGGIVCKFFLGSISSCAGENEPVFKPLEEGKTGHNRVAEMEPNFPYTLLMHGALHCWFAKRKWNVPGRRGERN